MARNKSRKSKIFIVTLIAVAVYCVISITVMQIDIAKREKALAAIQNELVEEQYRNKSMRSVLDAGNDMDYILRMAREKLGFIFPDERVFVDPNRS